MDITQVILAAMDNDNPQNKEAIQLINQYMKDCSVEYFDNLILASLSNNDKRFLDFATIAAKNFLLSKFSCIQVLRSQVWKQKQPQIRQEIVSNLLDRMIGGQDQVYMLLYAITVSSPIEEGHSIAQHVMNIAMSNVLNVNVTDTFKIQSAKYVLSVLKGNNDYYQPYLLDYLYYFLKNPIKNQILNIVEIVAHIATKLNNDIPEQIFNLIMQLFQLSIKDMKYDFIQIIYQIFQQGINTIDIMQRMVGEQYVIQILIEFSFQLVIYFNQAQDEQIFNKLENVLYTCAQFVVTLLMEQKTQIIYETQYIYQIIQNFVFAILQNTQLTNLNNNQLNQLQTQCLDILEIISKKARSVSNIDFFKNYINFVNSQQQFQQIPLIFSNPANMQQIASALQDNVMRTNIFVFSVMSISQANNQKINMLNNNTLLTTITSTILNFLAHADININYLNFLVLLVTKLIRKLLKFQSIDIQKNWINDIFAICKTKLVNIDDLKTVSEVLQLISYILTKMVKIDNNIKLKYFNIIQQSQLSNITFLIQVFIIDKQLFLDTEYLNTLRDIFIDQICERCFRLDADSNQKIELLYDTFVFLQTNMRGPNVLIQLKQSNQSGFTTACNLETVVIQIIESLAFNLQAVSNNNVILSHQFIAVFNSAKQILTETIQMLIQQNSYEYDQLLLAALNCSNVIEKLKICDVSQQFVFAITKHLFDLNDSGIQNEVFGFILQLLCDYISYLPSNEQEKVIQLCYTCLYSTADSSYPQISCVYFLTTLIENTTIQLDLNQLNTFIQGVFQNIQLFNLINDKDFTLVTMVRNLQSILIKQYPNQYTNILDYQLITMRFVEEIIQIFPSRIKQNGANEALYSIQYYNCLFHLTELFQENQNIKANVIKLIDKNRIVINNMITWIKQQEFNLNIQVFELQFQPILMK